MNRIGLIVALTFILSPVFSYADDKGMVVCTDPRPELCTMDYDPVCATRDNGVRCVTTPCDSIEEATYSNGCLACNDKRVFTYRPGICRAWTQMPDRK